MLYYFLANCDCGNTVKVEVSPIVSPVTETSKEQTIYKVSPCKTCMENSFTKGACEAMKSLGNIETRDN